MRRNNPSNFPASTFGRFANGSHYTSRRCARKNIRCLTLSAFLHANAHYLWLAATNEVFADRTRYETRRIIRINRRQRNGSQLYKRREQGNEQRSSTRFGGE
jgi:hypothetical protein